MTINDKSKETKVSSEASLLAELSALEEVDHCAGFGANQRWALVWFLGSLVVGGSMVFVLSQVDRFNYDTKGVFFDYDQYRENRKAITSIPSEEIDPRARPLNLIGK